LYDVLVLSRSFEFKGTPSFARHKTDIPVERPDALTRDFAADPRKQQQWTAFVEDVAFQAGTLPEVVDASAAFLMPRAAEARRLAGDKG
jgi:hypothetical protein